MHGRLKKAEHALGAAQQAEQRERVKKGVFLFRHLLDQKKKNCFTPENFGSTGKLLEVSPEIAVLWAYRRVMLSHFVQLLKSPPSPTPSTSVSASSSSSSSSSFPSPSSSFAVSSAGVSDARDATAACPSTSDSPSTAETALCVPKDGEKTLVLFGRKFDLDGDGRAAERLLLREELKVTLEAIGKKSAKSYCVWSHRTWTLGQLLASYLHADVASLSPSSSSLSPSSSLVSRRGGAERQEGERDVLGSEGERAGDGEGRLATGEEPRHGSTEPDFRAALAVLDEEIEHCNTLLLRRGEDGRNFHCWQHRSQIVAWRVAVEELRKQRTDKSLRGETARREALEMHSEEKTQNGFEHRSAAAVGVESATGEMKEAPTWAERQGGLAAREEQRGDGPAQEGARGAPGTNEGEEGESAKQIAATLELTKALIDKDFSNYSAWGRRVDGLAPGLVNWDAELDWIWQGLYTEPGDQALWKVYMSLLDCHVSRLSPSLLALFPFPASSSPSCLALCFCFSTPCSIDAAQSHCSLLFPGDSGRDAEPDAGNRLRGVWRPMNPLMADITAGVNPTIRDGGSPAMSPVWVFVARALPATSTRPENEESREEEEDACVAKKRRTDSATEERSTLEFLITFSRFAGAFDAEEQRAQDHHLLRLPESVMAQVRLGTVSSRDAASSTRPCCHSSAASVHTDSHEFPKRRIRFLVAPPSCSSSCSCSCWLSSSVPCRPPSPWRVISQRIVSSLSGLRLHDPRREEQESEEETRRERLVEKEIAKIDELLELEPSCKLAIEAKWHLLRTFKPRTSLGEQATLCRAMALVDPRHKRLHDARLLLLEVQRKVLSGGFFENQACHRLKSDARSAASALRATSSDSEKAEKQREGGEAKDPEERGEDSGPCEEHRCALDLSAMGLERLPYPLLADIGSRLDVLNLSGNLVADLFWAHSHIPFLPYLRVLNLRENKKITLLCPVLLAIADLPRLEQVDLAYTNLRPRREQESSPAFQLYRQLLLRHQECASRCKAMRAQPSSEADEIGREDSVWIPLRQRNGASLDISATPLAASVAPGEVLWSLFRVEKQRIDADGREEEKTLLLSV